MSCEGYRLSTPWSDIYAVKCKGVNVPDEVLSSIGGQDPLIFRAQSAASPCRAALAYLYSGEDYLLGEARLRKPSLWALTYVAEDPRASRVIGRARGWDSIFIVSESPTRALELASKVAGSEVRLDWLGTSCAPEELSEITAYRLTMLRARRA